MNEPFLGAKRLLDGPWQAFERDVARLLLADGFENVRVVGGVGDRGADVLGAKDGRVWVIQCKYTAGGYPPASAVEEVANAGRFHEANRMLVASSRRFGQATLDAVNRWKALGINIELLDPSTLMEMARIVPEYAASRRILKPYQEDAYEKLERSLRETRRGLVVLATGLGKTVVMAETVVRLLVDQLLPRGRVLVMAHTLPLVDQLQQAFWHQLPKWVHTHRLVEGERPSYWDGITFATVQSVEARLDELPDFDLVMIDEAHHVGSQTFQRVINHFSDALIGGFTATPWRGDGFDIEHVLGPPVVQIGIDEGLKKGFLCEADYRLYADNIDWKFVREQSRNRYSIKQLNTLLLLPARDDEAARQIRQVFDAEKRRAGIVFCASVPHAKSFAASLRLFGFSAEAVLGETPPAERDRLISQFRSGSLDFVTTCDLFNEGIDVPDVDIIAFMRVTHSRRIFVQQLGRGLRISPTKSKVVVLDFVSDLRRIAEVIELQRAVRGDIESVRAAGVVQFHDANAGSFIVEWMKDQASLILREGDPNLELPAFNFPTPLPGAHE